MYLKELKAKIIQTGMKQGEFGKLVDIPENKFCRAITGREKLPRAIRKKIALILACPEWELFPDDGREVRS